MDKDERHALTRRLFALMTAMLEDAATLAVEGQGAVRAEKFALLAAGIAEAAGQVSVLADAVIAISEPTE